ncbi:MAG: type III pantothenate kinase [Verrucomicrobiota bacterium JB023]|nr:type III pantothenate kinase [Verrucomicrobiota bacterium JB023]
MFRIQTSSRQLPTSNFQLPTSNFPAKPQDIKTLLIDNSNTRTKFALAGEGELLPWRQVLPTGDLYPQSIDHILPEGIGHATICSVVPDKADLLARVLAQRGIPSHRISSESQLPVQINYPNPAQIGADRLANAAAIAPLDDPAIVIDFGTAVTFDVVSPAGGGTYLGGVIAPGLESLRDYLPSRTALLPHIELAEPPSAIGRSTEHAMLVGAVIGYRGLIREILSSLSAELAATPSIISTGGDARLIASKMPEIHRVEPDLTLRGILKIDLLNHPPTGMI